MLNLTERSSDWLRKAREPTPENAETACAVVELAEAWRAGSLPLAGVRTACTGYDRFVAVSHATGPDRTLVLALLDALVADQDQRDGSIETKHGRFTRGDLGEVEALTTRDRAGRRVVQFPVGFFRTAEGVRRPIYREIPEHVLAEERGE